MDMVTSIDFYDIASGPPRRTFAPNPWKTRYALNFKKANYQTKWTEMPDIHNVREQLKVAANRTLPNGTAYHTLPVIHDHTTGAIVGDSFEIALYLDKTYPSTSPLFHTNTIGLMAALNQQVDKLFTSYIVLADRMPFATGIAAQVKTMFESRMGRALPDLPPEAREPLLVDFENALGEFVKAYYHVGGTTDYFWSKTGTNPAQAQKSGREQGVVFLDGDGETPTYADFIVGAWVAALAESMRPEEWERVRSWQGGFWGRLHDRLEPWREIK